MFDLNTRLAAAAIAAALVLAPAAVHAAGGSDGPSSPSATTKDSPYATAEKAVQAKDYIRAVAILEEVVRDDPKHADAWNYLGYGHRQLGDFETALASYMRALELKPDHRGAHEYLGELYLQMGKLEKAEEHLARLDKICFFSCQEYSELQKAIQMYRASHSG